MLIYKVTNEINNKCYIGQTINYLSRRKYQHLYKSKNKSKLVFHRAIRKYGEENFKWEVLENCDYIYQLNEMEHHYIKQYKSKLPNGYNMTDGYDNTTLGYKFTKEQKQIMSKQNSGKNNPNYGNGDKISGDKNPAKRPEVRKKISEAKMGKKRPDVIISKSKCYLIVDIKTNKEIIIKNLSKWSRENPLYKIGGLKCAIKKAPQYKGLWIRKIE
jgi:group I intron endonuclease